MRFIRSAAIGVTLAAASLNAAADSDYERGYREGYRAGFQDAQKSGGGRAAQGQGRKARGIVVIKARYGDDERGCDLTAWAAQRFNSRTSAEVDVTNEICGDPAPTQRKELTVDYLCDGEARSASAYEHRRLSLYCH